MWIDLQGQTVGKERINELFSSEVGGEQAVCRRKPLADCANVVETRKREVEKGSQGKAMGSGSEKQEHSATKGKT